ncbi:uncharacterized protein PAC_09078 [Phialocephala subalpina]|uniref:Uncharacterized protein n=1 Tax=Phialocephala subalpina TaxID=576137 RepID=A0A1L7X2D8_9HELO|nr:uncharacterized protein PAC_09078 [Phialocephala subalpina]
MVALVAPAALPSEGLNSPTVSMAFAKFYGWSTPVPPSGKIDEYCRVRDEEQGNVLGFPLTSPAAMRETMYLSGTGTGTGEGQLCLTASVVLNMNWSVRDAANIEGPWPRMNEDSNLPLINSRMQRSLLASSGSTPGTQLDNRLLDSERRKAGLDVEGTPRGTSLLAGVADGPLTISDSSSSEQLWLLPSDSEFLVVSGDFCSLQDELSTGASVASKAATIQTWSPSSESLGPVGLGPLAHPDPGLEGLEAAKKVSQATMEAAEERQKHSTAVGQPCIREVARLCLRKLLHSTMSANLQAMDSRDNEHSEKRLGTGIQCESPTSDDGRSTVLLQGVCAQGMWCSSRGCQGAMGPTRLTGTRWHLDDFPIAESANLTADSTKAFVQMPVWGTSVIAICGVELT